MENYLHRDAIIAAYSEQNIDLPLTANFGPFDDVPQAIARLVHEASGSQTTWDQLSAERKAEKEKQAKRMLCSRAARNMTLALLNEVDPDGDLLQWFTEIRDLLTGALKAP